MKHSKEGDFMVTKRVNLCFNLDNDKAKKAYGYINEQSAKTAFVVNAVIYYMESHNIIDKSLVKEAVRELFEEYSVGNSISNNGNRSDKDKKEKEGLPDDVFDMINNM